jgi:hypothetical protein
MQSHQSLIRHNLELLAQGHELLDRMDDGLYTADVVPLSARAVGCHFRHCLDFYDRLLTGVATGRVDYDARSRRQRIETDREFAMQEIQRLQEGIQALAGCEPELSLEVNLDNALAGTGDTAWSHSTLLRELQALVSHTVHHYALIGLLLKAQSFEPGEEFGVAPSTLEYLRQAQTHCSSS